MARITWLRPPTSSTSYAPVPSPLTLANRPPAPRPRVDPSKGALTDLQKSSRGSLGTVSVTTVTSVAERRPKVEKACPARGKPSTSLANGHGLGSDWSEDM